LSHCSVASAHDFSSDLFQFLATDCALSDHQRFALIWLLFASSVASVPPNLESKSGASFPPLLGTSSPPHFWAQVFPLAFFPSLPSDK